MNIIIPDTCRIPAIEFIKLISRYGYTFTCGGNDLCIVEVEEFQPWKPEHEAIFKEGV